MSSRFLKVLSGDEVDTVPVWLMRQAGRYLPGYRKLREGHSIMELAKDPRLAVEITLEPLRLFDLDAGIVFADIVHPLEGIGMDVRLDPGTGPVLPGPLRKEEDLRSLSLPLDARAATGFVGETIRLFREASDLPIIGFSAAPFTLACYAVEGGYQREFPTVRRELLGSPSFMHHLLSVLSDVVTEYLKMQVKAGAHALQLFDTWAGLLSARQYESFGLPYIQRIIEELDVPVIYFSTSSSHLLSLQRRLGATAFGVDWRISLSTARGLLGDNIILQGNLDPTALLCQKGEMERAAREVLANAPREGGHIFNLGHGVLPETEPQMVRDLVDIVHSTARK